MVKVLNTTKLVDYVQEKGITKEFQQHFSNLSIPKQLKLTKMSTEIINELCDKINEKNLLVVNKKEKQTLKNGTGWKMGEYKLFIWVSVFYSYNSRMSIQSMKDTDFQFINSFFPTKTLLRLKYELLCLFPIPEMKKAWCAQEIQLFKELVSKQPQGQKRIEWKVISFNIYYQSQGIFFKTFSQCRQMWNNHLDSNINKSNWTKEEDYLLLVLAQQEEKSWSKISKHFNEKRTAHMVKNRYNALMKLVKRYHIRMSDRQAENRLIKNLAARIGKQKQGSTTMESQPNLEIKSKDSDFSCELSETKSSLDCPIKELQSNEDMYIMQWGLPHLQKMTTTIQEEDSLVDLKIIDIDMCEIPKYFTQKDDLLQKLGCSHIEQVEEAFQSYNNEHLIPFF